MRTGGSDREEADHSGRRDQCAGAERICLGRTPSNGDRRGLRSPEATPSSDCSEPRPLTDRNTPDAVSLAGVHGYHIYDSLIIASALEASCAVLYSEDLQDGQAIGPLTIRNPFR